MADVKFKSVVGKAEMDFQLQAFDVEEGDPTMEEMIDSTQTVVLRGVKKGMVVPPHDDYALFDDNPEKPSVRSRYRVAVLFAAFGIEEGDLLADLEAALSDSPALIHSCQDFNAPETCRACALLHRVQRLRRQMTP